MRGKSHAGRRSRPLPRKTPSLWACLVRQTHIQARQVERDPEEGACRHVPFEGDPTQDLSLVASPDSNFRVIMKGGTLYKNTL
jgi:hypothetical protein